MEDRVLILDAGTGIRPLGHHLLGGDKPIYVALTHVHSDHVEGFPFFKPLYEESRPIYLIDHVYDDVRWSLLDCLDGFHFPLEPGDIPARLERVKEDAVSFLNDAGFSLARRPVNHPGGAYGYRVDLNGRSVVHIPDNEINPPGSVVTTLADLADFCAGANVLLHDTQYLWEDLPEKSGWGHSILRDVCELARRADVEHLVLFHHDPDRTDDALDAMQADAEARLADDGIRCTAAYEGLTL
jgi:ribonuclease BN (tRNA processing enzyme)